MIAPQRADLSLPLPERPYRGIDSFRLVDHSIFCARQQEVQKLFRAIVIYRGVLLYGASGVGKSSLVNAGLLPELLAEGFSPERIRVQPRRHQEVIVERIPRTADGRPPYLPSLFADGEDGESRVVLSAEELSARLRKIEGGSRPLLIFDQFEEFVTQFEEAPQAVNRQEAAAAQDALLGALTELLRDHSFPVKLLFSFREDYLARLNKLFAVYPSLTDQYLRLVPPDKSALPEIIRGPFRNESLRQHFGKALPEEVAEELAHEIDAHRQGGPVNLSEVEIASLRLWESPDPAALLKNRHVQGLLEDYLADSLQSLASLRDPAIALLSRMVTKRGTRNVISEEDLLNQVRDEEKIPEAVLRQALSKLDKETGLVRRERRNDVYVYEIVSEFLVPWIRVQKQKRSDRREMRRWLVRVAAATVLTLLALGGALVWRNSENVVLQAAQEETRKALNEAAGSSAEAQRERDRAEQLLRTVRTQTEAREKEWTLRLANLQTQRDQDLQSLRSQLTGTASQQQQALLEQLQKEQSTATKAQKELYGCESDSENTRNALRAQQAAVNVCQEERQKAEAVASQKLNECEERVKQRCPEAYNVREVAALFGKLLYDHTELQEELAALESTELTPQGARALEDAIEQQREAKDRLNQLRKLLGLDSIRTLG
ncbi:MAG TPA: hypothetical protein VMW27_05235 [Thermoanaerobaculia bacterium]|nr:hypothetical protein [Thermoanaerobaculia bacterium]